jgi:hypothetical protein
MLPKGVFPQREIPDERIDKPVTPGAAFLFSAVNPDPSRGQQ